jgi:hypothetical protein
MALPSLIGVVLQHVRPERAGAAAGILTTTQQFGAASGIAIVGAVFYGAIGAVPGRASFVSGMVVAIAVNAVLLAAASAVSLLLRRTEPAPAAIPASQVPVHADVAG